MAGYSRPYLFRSGVASGDPGAGSFRLSNVAPELATLAFIDELDANGVNADELLAALLASDLLRVRHASDLDLWHTYSLTGPAIDRTGYWELPLRWEVSSSLPLTLTNTDTLELVFYRSDLAPLIEWTDGPRILTAAGVASPSTDQTEWANACAGGVNQAFELVLEGSGVTGFELELRNAALNAGVEAFKRREAVFGVTGYVDLQGAALRIARDYLEGQRPIIARYATFGLG